jgi:prepilin-type N-terminal cleavage/methylation domain-containing protein
MTPQRSIRTAGFTMLELLIALLIFGTISGAVFSLVAKNQPIFGQQQNLAEVNISLRNAIAQMQLDIANAGANYYSGVNIPNYPVGLVVTNNVVPSGGDCRSGSNYGSTCFDSFSIITADTNTPPTNPWSSTLSSIDTSVANSTIPNTTYGTVYLSPSGSGTGYGPGASAPAAVTAAAALYSAGDQILFVTGDGSHFTTAKLAIAGTPAKLGGASGNWYVLLTYGPTLGGLPSAGTAGHNTPSPTASNQHPCANDWYNLTTNSDTTYTMLTNSFSNSDYVLRILPINYGVDLTDPTNPVLTRTVAGTTPTLAQKTLATQIIGFKLGASLYNNANDQDTTQYSFDASQYNPGTTSTTAAPYNYTLVRSLMISLIGRTKPATDPTYKFRNTFDSGAYEIQGVSAVINPRNMSMLDR